MNTPQSTTTARAFALDLSLDTEVVKNELALTDPNSIHADPETDPELDKKASQFAEMLVNLDTRDFDAQEGAKLSVEDMGRGLQREAAHRSKMLQQPIKDLSEHGGEGGPVANALIDLKMKVEELDPASFDFSAGWFTRTLGLIIWNRDTHKALLHEVRECSDCRRRNHPVARAGPGSAQARQRHAP